MHVQNLNRYRISLDLAKEYHQQAILTALEELVRQTEIALILPRTVVDEFARNKARVIEDSAKLHL